MIEPGRQILEEEHIKGLNTKLAILEKTPVTGLKYKIGRGPYYRVKV